MPPAADTCKRVEAVFKVVGNRTRGRTQTTDFGKIMTKVRATIPRNENDCSRVGCQCMYGKDLAINRGYFEDHIVPRTTFILYITDEKGRFCGYALGHEKRHQIQGTPTPFIYIDLICSAKRKGAALLSAAETFARGGGARRIALRAATKGLIPYYLKKGFTRSPDQCVMRRITRSSSIELRKLDANAEFKDGGAQ